MGLEVIVALDQGSGSSRAIAFDRRGRAVARAQSPVRSFFPKAGFCEHDSVEIALTQEGVLRAVIERLPRAAEVVALGLACQRSTVIFWDCRTGRPAPRCPTWQDGRAAGLVAGLGRHDALVRRRTGLYLTPYYSAPKIRWALEHDARVRKLAGAGRLRAGPVSSFLLWRLTKGEVFACDPSLAQRMLLLDLAAGSWSPDLLALFGIDATALPAVVPSAGQLCVLEVAGRRIPVMSFLGDQQAAAIGLGGRAAGSAVANYGTGAFMLRNTGVKARRAPGLLTSAGWKTPDGRVCFLEEGTVHAAGSSITWLREKLALLPPSENGIDAACRASRERVWALPAIGGLGAPRWDYRTPAVFFGLTSQTRPQDLVRGVVEGLAFLMADIAQAMRRGGAPVRSLKASGGLSRSDYLMQFQADILGARVERCAELEATARGAASLAAEALGERAWARVLGSPRIERAFSPRMAGAERSRLRSFWRGFVDAQAALSRLS